MLARLLRVSWKLEIFNDQVSGKMTHIRKCEEITLWPGIWWHDAMYHEDDHYLKWPRSVNVGISFLSRPAEGAVVLRTSCHFFKNDANILETIIHKLNFLLFVQNHKRNIWDKMNVIHTYHSEIDLSKRFSS